MEALLDEGVAQLTEETLVPPLMPAEDFNRVYKEHSDKVFHFILSKRIPYHDALEVSQEVFLLVYKRFHQLKDSEKIQSWIMEIAFTSIQTYFRRKKHTMVSFSAFNTPERTQAFVVTDPAGNQPFLQAIQQESISLMRQQIKELSVTDREIIGICDIEGDKMREAADKLQIPEGTVKRRLFTARDRLQQKMRKTFSHKDFFN